MRVAAVLFALVLPVTAWADGQQVELGRRLFHDPRLSGNGTTSCASCHFENLAFADGKILSEGSTGMPTHRNSPGLFNLAWLDTLTWANPALVTLERQAEVPLFGTDPVEMGVTDENTPEVLDRLRDDAELMALFERAYPGRPVAFDTIIVALAAFERSLIASHSRYDAHLKGRLSLNESEKRGMELFFSPQGGCSACHDGFAFTSPGFHDARIHGLTDFAYPNRGLFELTGQAQDVGRFRAAPLRNLSFTAPYMHDGRMATLEQVVAAYDGGRLSDRERQDMLAFLRALDEIR